MAENTLQDGSALERLVAMVKAQGGDTSVILNPDTFAKAPYSREIIARKEGYLVAMDTESCGIASSMLGAGRETKDSEIDFLAGIILHKKTGDYIKEGDSLATFYSSKEELFAPAEERYRKALTFQEEKPGRETLIFARVTKDTVERTEILM